MSTSRLLLLVLIAATPLVGCGEGPLAPADAPDSSPPAVSRSIADGPSQPGSSPVFRIEIGARVWFAFWSPEPRPTVVLYQTDDSFDFPWADCGTATVTTELVDLQQIARPSGALGQLLQAPEVLISVYDAGAFVGPPLLTCGFLLGAHRLADGTGRILTTDTDRTTTGPGTRTVAWAGTGLLTGVEDGSTLTLNHQYHFQVNTADGGVKTLLNEIRISPDPRQPAGGS